MCVSEATADVVTYTRRNHVLGVMAGALGSMAYAFLHPDLIIAGMIYALTGSWHLVAVTSIINKAGFLGPQLWASSRLEHRPVFVQSLIGYNFWLGEGFHRFGTERVTGEHYLARIELILDCSQNRDTAERSDLKVPLIF